jgi:hypothetical protein
MVFCDLFYLSAFPLCDRIMILNLPYVTGWEMGRGNNTASRYRGSIVRKRLAASLWHKNQAPIRRRSPTWGYHGNACSTWVYVYAVSFPLRSFAWSIFEMNSTGWLLNVDSSHYSSLLLHISRLSAVSVEDSKGQGYIFDADCETPTNGITQGDGEVHLYSNSRVLWWGLACAWVVDVVHASRGDETESEGASDPYARRYHRVSCFKKLHQSTQPWNWACLVSSDP